MTERLSEERLREVAEHDGRATERALMAREILTLRRELETGGEVWLAGRVAELKEEVARVRQANENNLAGWMNDRAGMSRKMERLEAIERLARAVKVAAYTTPEGHDDEPGGLWTGPALEYAVEALVTAEEMKS